MLGILNSDIYKRYEYDENYMKTLNKLFIALSLLIYFTTMSMAQISEIPFNLGISGKVFSFEYQNHS